MSKFITKLKFVPSMLTCSSAFCGMLATVLALDGEKSLIYASYLILLASVFDFSDGFAARLLHASSELGKQLDSLADAISFGVAPSAIMFQLLKSSMRLNGTLISCEGWQIAIMLSSLLIGIFAILRLAKFNIDPDQAHSFKGLASPACAIFIASIPLISAMVPEDFWIFKAAHAIWNVHFPMKLEFALLGLEVFIFGKWFWVLPMCLFFGAMMVTNLPMFSLKMKSYKYSENKTVFNFLIYAIILIVVLQWIAIPLIMFSYVIVSFVIWTKNRNKNEELVTNTSSSLA